MTSPGQTIVTQPHETYSILNLPCLDGECANLKKSLWKEVKSDYIGLMDALAVANSHKLSILASITLSRNRHLSRIFESMLNLALIDAIVTRQQDRIITKIIATNPNEALLLARYLNSKGLSHIPVVSVIKHSPRMKIFRDWLYSFWHLTMQWLIVRVSGYKVDAHAHKNLVLLDSFLIPDMMQAGSLQDRYYQNFNGMLELDPSLKKPIYIIPTLAYFGLRSYKRLFGVLRNLAPSKGFPFFFKESILSLPQVWSSLFVPSRSLDFELPLAHQTFRGVDLRPLLAHEIKSNRYFFPAIIAKVMYRFTEILAKRGFHIDLVVDWHENQPLDRMLCRGVHDFLPKTKIIAHQGFAVQRAVDFYVNPTQAEVSLNLCPNIIFVTGCKYLNATKESYPTLDVRVGPAFRFTQIHATSLSKPKGTRTLLITLPLSHPNLEDFVQALKSLQTHAPDIQLLIKPHPAALAFACELADDLRALVFRGSFYEALDQCFGVVFVGSSTTLIEAVVLKRPAIIWETRDEILDIPPEILKGSLIAASPWELIHAVNTLIHQPDQFSFAAREDYFCPVTKESVTRFLEI